MATMDAKAFVDTGILLRGMVPRMELHQEAEALIHDANLVATMLAHDIDTLLTLNTANFERFAPAIRIIAVPA